MSTISLSPRLFRLAMSFLSRLSPPVMAGPEDLAASAVFFPLVGAVLGAIMTLPFGWGLFAASPGIQAWGCILLGVWLTRGLHWDGVGDLCDALGGGNSTENFWRIMKDSRMGAFGVMALVLGLGGQILLVRESFAADDYLVVIWAMTLGRLAILPFCLVSRQFSRVGMGKVFMAGITSRITLVSCGFALLLGLFLVSMPVLLCSLALCALGLAWLRKVGISRQGVNGDFLGTCVILGECSALVAWLLFQ